MRPAQSTGLKPETPSPANTLSGDESLQLPEFDSPPDDPVALLGTWIAAAEGVVREPLAVTLATSDSSGVPSTRVVLLKGVEETGGLVFTTHHGSRKGHDLRSNPYAAINFYWRETLQQINVVGSVTRLDDAEADQLFSARPLAAQATTAASNQGAPLADEQELHRRAEALAQTDGPVPRPDGWGGYRLRIERIEFWQGRSSRLHRRLSYTLDDQGWTASRLQP
ncbi:MAG: pyridoxamine 5'-phosphate oxidase [Nocardioides sp.]|nr:pyridoxamine 5'-phosphate oxidase [Nocardioides sp.]